MAILLDTADLAADDRHDVFREAMLEASGATRVELERPRGGVVGRMELHSLGATRVFTAHSTGIALVRDRRTAAGASPEAVAIAVHGRGVGRHQAGDRQRLVRSGDVMVVDVTRPFDFSWSVIGSSTSLQLPIADLGLPLHVVQQAAGRLETSPLYGLVRRYLVDLARDAEQLSSGPAAAALGEASVQLIRALLAGAADDPARAREVQEQTLLAQVRAQVQAHLHDPALDADRIAASLAVSRRQLFRVCRQADFSIEQYVIAQRLAGAKKALADPTTRHQSIAYVAHSWGFKDATHFGRRFKAAYGMLPRDWRRLAADEAVDRSD